METGVKNLKRFKALGLLMCIGLTVTLVAFWLTTKDVAKANGTLYLVFLMAIASSISYKILTTDTE
jgi:heme/copper-type cytochrome/quinol oxidase subunit 4